MHYLFDFSDNMEGKGKLGTRNWDFLDHTDHPGSELDPPLAISLPQGNINENQGGFLKMNAYSDDPESSSMEFSWVPPRSFLSPTNDEEEHQVNKEADDESEAKPTKIRKKQATAKVTNCVDAKAPRPKEPNKRPVPRKKKGSHAESTLKREKKNQDENFEGVMLDLSHVPVPVCTCTGVPRQCYRWGSGGWQSSCCTTSVSQYPLPMSSSRPSARLAGRKMSISAYRKLLQRLANGGHDLSYGVDLKDHWARHGTNKFVTIR